jgi:tetratricopeptide (TPR) repeat protein
MADHLIPEMVSSAEKCMQDGKFAEAFFHWTKIIHFAEQKSELQPTMYTQRAKCFIMNEQFHYALEDSKKAMDMNPDNAICHLRMAEVYYETEHYMEALPIIGKCFELTCGKAEKDHLLAWQQKCRKKFNAQKLKESVF